MSRSNKLKAMFVCVSLIFMLAVPSLAQGDTIKIGLISSLTGSVSTYGQSVRNAVTMAIDDINAAGGINGRQINLVILDDKGDGTEAAQAARRLIDRENVALILGPVITPAVMAVAPIAQSAGIPMLTPTGTGDQITTVGDFIFRGAYKDSFQGRIMAQFAIENLGLKEAAIIYDVANDYSVGLREAFKSTFEELGGKIIAEESYSTGDTDFSAQLTSLAMRNPQALFIPDYYSTAGPILMQARLMGMDSVMLGVDGWDSPDLSALAGGFEEGGYIVNHYSADVDSQVTQDFIAQYTAKFGQAPDALAALGYDGVLIVAKALEAAGSTDPEALKQALGTVGNIEAATGTINMDPEGTPIKSAVILKITGGKWELVDRIDPIGR
ncbi:MAG TPA: ABC transporter substrate-binding protein [Firmicutes bacterium]|jgi:branched-chain amino acid transport system substrate-binding protein|nr:ABC transporter substrate-binding protein [Bacillota bacterium]HHT42255.1 ABC transporter substrate-binding protein [Bacillota bacterium]